MEIQKTDDSQEITNKTEHSLHSNPEAIIYFESLNDEKTGSKTNIDLFLAAVGETDLVSDPDGKVAEYLKTVNEALRSSLRGFVSYVFETGPTFGREGEGADDLIVAGRNKYAELADVEDGIYDWTGEIAMSVMMEEIENVNEIRLELLGALDAARAVGDDTNAREIKDILTSVLEIDIGEDPWLDVPEDKTE